VLDTNVYSYERPDNLARLAGRGLVLRASDIALLEAWAKSVREYQGGMPLKQARGMLFTRARAVAPYLDKRAPIAVSGNRVEAIKAMAEGRPYDDAEGKRYARHIGELWDTLVGPGMSDDLWIRNGTVAQKYLDELDERLFLLARREEELRKNPVPAGVDPATLAVGYQAWDSFTGDEQLALLRDYARESWKLSDAAAERLDGHIRVTALRLHLGALGTRMPKKNDGADAALTIHLGEGYVLVTNENPLVDLVDQSKTFQAPWVRRMNDLDDLPEGPPWGESAREAARVFRRRATTT
jgi:hypothetical protein